MAIPPLAMAVTSNQATAALLPTLPPPSPACLLIRWPNSPSCSVVSSTTKNLQDLSVAGYGMPSLSASGATIASPDSSLKPELRFSAFFYVYSAACGRDNSFHFLETFAKLPTDGQSESCSQTAQTLSHPSPHICSYSDLQMESEDIVWLNRI